MTKCCFLFLPFLLMSTILMILMNLPHPIYAITMALLYSMILSASMAIWKINYIAPIMFSLIMISGLMIIFMYFSSLVSNTKNKMTKLTLMFMMTINLTIILTTPSFYTPLTQLPDLMYLTMKNQTIDPMIAMYIPPLQSLTTLSMFYLLITMMSIIKSCSPRAKSMRTTKSLKT